MLHSSFELSFLSDYLCAEMLKNECNKLLYNSAVETLKKKYKLVFEAVGIDKEQQGGFLRERDL